MNHDQVRFNSEAKLTQWIKIKKHTILNKRKTKQTACLSQ
jgi:hypothetical protein